MLPIISQSPAAKSLNERLKSEAQEIDRILTTLAGKNQLSAYIQLEDKYIVEKRENELPYVWDKTTYSVAAADREMFDYVISHDSVSVITELKTWNYEKKACFKRIAEFIRDKETLTHEEWIFLSENAPTRSTWDYWEYIFDAYIDNNRGNAIVELPDTVLKEISFALLSDHNWNLILWKAAAALLHVTDSTRYDEGHDQFRMTLVQLVTRQAEHVKCLDEKLAKQRRRPHRQVELIREYQGILAHIFAFGVSLPFTCKETETYMKFIWEHYLDSKGKLNAVSLPNINHQNLNEYLNKHGYKLTYKQRTMLDLLLAVPENRRDRIDEYVEAAVELQANMPNAAVRAIKPAFEKGVDPEDIMAFIPEVA